MDSRYFQAWIYKWAMVFVLAGAVNWLMTGIFGVNLVRSLLGQGVLAWFVYLIIGVAGLALLFRRDTYLPFLGETHLSCAVLQNRDPPGATLSVRITVPPNKKVLYWAAEPASDALKDVLTWKDAYRGYENAGVTTSRPDGVAILKVRAPQSYTVPFRGVLSPHVHYRVCEEAGWMGRVETVSAAEDPQGFENIASMEEISS